MSRGSPRRPASSRTPVSRPRRVAGRGGGSAAAPVAPPVEVVEPETLEPETLEPETLEPETLEPETLEPDAVEDGDGQHVGAAPDEAPAVDRRGLGVLFDSRRVTVVLAALIVVLGVVAGGLAIWQATSDSGEADLKPPPKGQIAVPDGRPVLIDGQDATSAAATAAEAATTLFTRTHEDYDAQVDEATALMTDDFAETFRKTTEDVKDAFVAEKTEVDVRVVAQGIVRANRSQVQALLFLNQYVSKDGGDTTYTPYRALVTMVHTDGGWLVSDLDTK